MDSQLSLDSLSSKPVSSDHIIISPRTYLYARDGPNARIWALSDEEARNRSRKTLDELGNSLGTLTSVIAESTPNPFKTKVEITRSFSGSSLVLTFSDENPGNTYILWEGAGPQSEAFPNSKRLMDVKPESVIGNTSVYTDADDPEGRTARMNKAENNWLSINRTLEDFDGMQYVWKTDLMDNLKCMRSDGTEMAYFHRTKFAWIEIVGPTVDTKQNVISTRMFRFAGLT